MTCSGSGTSWTCTAGSTPAQVTSAIASMSNDGVLTLLTGAYSWSSAVSINKPMTLAGEGVGNTIITYTGLSGTAPISIDYTSSFASSYTRVTGIEFALGSTANGRRALSINGNHDNQFAVTNLRIDHLKLVGGGNDSGAIQIDGRVYGVADHITGTNNYSTFYIVGDRNWAWQRAQDAGAVLAGTGDAWFIEDSTMNYTGAALNVGGTTLDASVYIQGAASVVSRYNNFNSTSLTAINFITLMYNNHGNQQYNIGVTNSALTFRSQPIFETYNNNVHGGETWDIYGIRGGSFLMHDETIISDNPVDTPVKLQEEEFNQPAFFTPLRTVWPGQDQIFNSFIWNNTWQGSALTTSQVNIVDTTAIQINRDLFMHAPASTGGIETFTGSRWGGSTTSPTSSDTGNMIFTSSGANAYYPYTPYRYPHPARVHWGPGPPTNLRAGP